jgi:hypothetical protein
MTTASIDASAPFPDTAKTTDLLRGCALAKSGCDKEKIIPIETSRKAGEKIDQRFIAGELILTRGLLLLRTDEGKAAL